MTDKTDSKERDLMALVDAYAEARHIGGCHTYNAKTAEARNAVIAKLAASAGSEPVAWQSRTRPTWGSNTRPWSPWEPCTKEQAEDCWKTPLLHDWAYEARALFTAPQPAPVRDESAARDECKRRWLAEDEDCNLLEAYDRGWKDRAARATADSVTAPAGDDFQPCPSCFGKGVDGDVDDYGHTIDVSCGECNGSGRAAPTTKQEQ